MFQSRYYPATCLRRLRKPTKNIRKVGALEKNRIRYPRTRTVPPLRASHCKRSLEERVSSNTVSWPRHKSGGDYRLVSPSGAINHCPLSNERSRCGAETLWRDVDKWWRRRTPVQWATPISYMGVLSHVVELKITVTQLCGPVSNPSPRLTVTNKHVSSY